MTKNKFPEIGWMENRNGCPGISSITVENSIWSGNIIIRGINCSGRVLRGGISAPVIALMYALKPYFEKAGYIITRKEEENARQ